MEFSPLQTADLAWENTGNPTSRAYGDVYFSRENGLAETRHVFLQGNRLEERFAAADRFVIAETGFGTGLNFLAAKDLFERIAPSSAGLHFLSVEKYPLRREDMRRALDVFPETAAHADAMVPKLPEAAPGFHRVHFGRVTLTLLYGDAMEVLPQLEATVDAWFLDGFAPAKNPGLWQTEIYAQLARLSAPRATVATFTVAGAVRRGLREAGFSVRKVRGFGRKREMLVAEKTG